MPNLPIHPKFSKPFQGPEWGTKLKLQHPVPHRPTNTTQLSLPAEILTLLPLRPAEQERLALNSQNKLSHSTSWKLTPSLCTEEELCEQWWDLIEQSKNTASAIQSNCKSLHQHAWEGMLGAICILTEEKYTEEKVGRRKLLGNHYKTHFAIRR